MTEDPFFYSAMMLLLAAGTLLFGGMLMLWSLVKSMGWKYALMYLGGYALTYIAFGIAGLGLAMAPIAEEKGKLKKIGGYEVNVPARKIVKK